MCLVACWWRPTPTSNHHFSLTGIAAEVIQSLEISSSNYSIAWKLLTERFQNKRVIIQTHLKAIFEIKPVVKESATSLRSLYDNAQKHLRALAALGLPVEHWDALLIYIISTKFDLTTNREWEAYLLSIENKELATFDDLATFLTKRCQILEATSNHRSQFIDNSSNNKFNNNKSIRHSAIPQRNVSTSHVASSLACYYCKQSHGIYHCPSFLKLPIPQRKAQIQRLELCNNCLKPNHIAVNCKSGTCKICKARHNTLLHFTIAKGHSDRSNNQNSTSGPLPNVLQCENQSKTNHESRPLTTASSNHSINTSSTILSTALVYVSDKYGNLHICRALLDSGSESCFISEHLCQQLRLRRTRVCIPLYGINQSNSHVNHSVTLTIQSRSSSNHNFTLECYVLPKITQDLPTSQINVKGFQIPNDIKLADPTFYAPGSIDLLLGAEVFWGLLESRSINLYNDNSILHLQETKLGWVVSGKLRNSSSQKQYKSINLAISSTFDVSSLDSQLSKFWEIEDCPEQLQSFSEEQLFSEKHFVSNTTRDKSGRFIVKLPFLENKQVGNSLEVAIKRFYNIEKRLNKDKLLKSQYSKFLHEYLALGHMEYVGLLEDVSLTQSHFYLPHHAVVKQDSSTTRLRVVFDGSVKSSTGVSLNEALAVGPTIQDELFSLLMRFRTHRYALTADIEKMYRQIKIELPDADYQRVLWRDDPDDPIQIFRLTTVTYGTSCAPFLAIRCLHELANYEQANYPLGSNIILKDFYVDDLLTGSDTVEGAIDIRNQVIAILKQGGFNLRKWSSNEMQVLRELPPESIECNSMNLELDSAIKTLGLWWNPSRDTFQYKVSVHNETNSTITKRHVISEIAKLFDPLGLLGPIIVSFKIFLQQLWKQSFNWDDELPVELQRQWNSLRSQLSIIPQLEIPRFIFGDMAIVPVQLHGFCDASELAYGACVYVRVNCNNNVKTVLICSKSRVAPIKQVTLPRLELCGALLLTRLLRKIIPALNLRIDSVNCWTDSKIVLSWLQGSPGQWKTFVANRVSKIQESSKGWIWGHITSQDNPADLVSRGTMPSRFINSVIWWLGPNWLQLPVVPVVDNHILNSDIIPECKKTTTLVANTSVKFDIFNKYSSFIKLQRVTAYILRFINNLKSNIESRKYDSLSVSELNNATTMLIKLVQQSEFKNEFNDLQKFGKVNKKSNLSSLVPFVDKDGLLRLRGRLKNAELTYDRKYQIILPKNHNLTKLLMTYEHIRNLHVGPQSLLATFRLKYWPINGRQLANSIVHNCLQCFKAKPKGNQPIMGDLPSYRLNPGKVFSSTGVDFFGPVHIISNKNVRRKIPIKAYGAIFVCFTTRAVHIELVGDLSSQSFINALKRFISRRGKISHLFCDNGTNFIGANRELSDLFNTFREENFQNKVSQYLTQESIVWHFSPPRAPHFGGLWEAAVKSFKYHFKRIVSDTLLTFEEMYTLFVQIEACLNSRPITPLSNNPDDLAVLTPGHFLLGDSPAAIWEPDLTTITENRLSRWQLMQRLLQHLWRRWSTEYLQTLQKRSKWQSSSNNLKLNDMVLIQEDNLPPTQWSMGRIIATHPGSDGVVRVVTVRTSTGTYKRPSAKLCVLPIESSTDSITNQ